MSPRRHMREKRQNLERLTSDYLRGRISLDEYVSSTGSSENQVNLRRVLRSQKRRASARTGRS